MWQHWRATLPWARDSLEEPRCRGIGSLARDYIWYGYRRNVGCTPNAQKARAEVYNDDVRTASSLTEANPQP